MGILRNDPKLRRAYMAYQNDGVLDVFVGWCVFLAGLLMFTEIFYLAGAYVVLITPLFLSFKETVTVPRLAGNELDQATGRKSVALQPLLALGVALLALLGLVVLYLLVIVKSAAGPRTVVLTIVAGIIAVVVLSGFAVVGHLYKAQRWYAYGALAIALVALAWATGLALPWVIMAVGATIAMTGSVYLFRFLRSHPLLPLGQRPQW